MDVELRPKLVGQRIKRFEDPRLLAGVGRFVDDITPPGTLFIAFRSDHPHALIKSIDLGAALSVPGVIGRYPSAGGTTPRTKPATAPDKRWRRQPRR